MHHPDALPQCDARRWPTRHNCPVGRFSHLEVVHASDVFDTLRIERLKAKKKPRRMTGLKAS
jgi:hypothetical protein